MKHLAFLAVMLLAACGQKNSEDGVALPPEPPGVDSLGANAEPALPANLFALPVRGLDGAATSLEPYSGKVVLLNFWATWCAPCRQEIPDLIALRDRLGPRGFEVVGISMDVEVEGDDVVRPFVEEFEIDYPIVRGDQATADAVGGMFGLPTTLIVDTDGNLVRRFSGLVPVEDLEPLLEALLPQ